MLTAQQQTLFDNAKLLCETIRKTQNHGRHDGLGNPTIAPELYEQWADEACDGVEWLLAVAPDLLEACKMAERYLDLVLPAGPTPFTIRLLDKHLRQLRQAIAKAALPQPTNPTEEADTGNSEN